MWIRGGEGYALLHLRASHMRSALLVRSNLVPNAWLVAAEQSSSAPAAVSGAGLMPAVVRDPIHEEPEDDEFMPSSPQRGGAEGVHDDDWSQSRGGGERKQQRIPTVVTISFAILLVSVLTVKLVAMRADTLRAEMGYSTIQPEARGDIVAHRATNQRLARTHDDAPPPAMQHSQLHPGSGPHSDTIATSATRWEDNELVMD